MSVAEHTAISNQEDLCGKVKLPGGGESPLNAGPAVAGSGCHAERLGASSPETTAAGNPVQPSIAQHELSQDVLRITSGTLRCLTTQDLLAISQMVYGEMYQRLSPGHIAAVLSVAECQAARRVLLHNLQSSLYFGSAALKENIAHFNRAQGEKLARGSAPKTAGEGACATDKNDISIHGATLGLAWKKTLARAQLDGRDIAPELLDQTLAQALAVCGLKGKPATVREAQGWLLTNTNPADAALLREIFTPAEGEK